MSTMITRIRLSLYLNKIAMSCRKRHLTLPSMSFVKRTDNISGSRVETKCLKSCFRLKEKVSRSVSQNPKRLLDTYLTAKCSTCLSDWLLQASDTRSHWIAVLQLAIDIAFSLENLNILGRISNKLGFLKTNLDIG